VEKAREQFREGVALMAADDWAGALAKFKSVRQVRMNAQVAFNIAECEAKLGRLVSALGNYRLALNMSNEPGAEKVAAAAPGQIAALEPRIAKLTVKRKAATENPHATIELDGVELGTGQIGNAVSVDPGDRTLRVIVAGQPVATEKFKLADGEAREVTMTIPPPRTTSGGSVGPTTGVTSGPSIPGIVLTAFGGATLIAGAVFIGLRQVAIGELDDLCGGDSTCPPSAEDTYDRGRLMTGLAEVFIPVGAASAVVGVVLLATMSGKKIDPDAASTEPTLVFAAPDGQGPGLSLSTRF